MGGHSQLMFSFCVVTFSLFWHTCFRLCITGALRLFLFEVKNWKHSIFSHLVDYLLYAVWIKLTGLENLVRSEIQTVDHSETLYFTRHIWPQSIETTEIDKDRQKILLGSLTIGRVSFPSAVLNAGPAIGHLLFQPSLNIVNGDLLTLTNCIKKGRDSFSSRKQILVY